MSLKKKPRPKQSSGPITFKLAGGDIVAIVARQKAWAYGVATDIERGSLPSPEDERRMIATIIRHAADRIRAPSAPKKRGNPKFQRKLPDDDQVAVAVGWRIALGDELQVAIDRVAGDFDADASTIAKLFRERREAVARFFLNSNLAHRYGAIRGK